MILYSVHHKTNAYCTLPKRWITSKWDYSQKQKPSSCDACNQNIILYQLCIIMHNWEDDDFNDFQWTLLLKHTGCSKKEATRTKGRLTKTQKRLFISPGLVFCSLCFALQKQTGPSVFAQTSITFTYNIFLSFSSSSGFFVLCSLQRWIPPVS